MIFALRHAIASAQDAYPELRLCQIIVNATGKSDLFYVTDEELCEALDAYTEVRAQ